MTIENKSKTLTKLKKMRIQNFSTFHQHTHPCIGHLTASMQLVVIFTFIIRKKTSGSFINPENWLSHVPSLNKILRMIFKNLLLIHWAWNKLRCVKIVCLTGIFIFLLPPFAFSVMQENFSSYVGKLNQSHIVGCFFGPLFSVRQKSKESFSKWEKESNSVLFST